MKQSKAWPALPWGASRADSDYGAPAEPDWRAIDWRPHLREMQIGGRRVNYVDCGEARSGGTVVLIHGLGGCWQNWLETIPRLAADGRRAIALDLPGFGESDLPADEISLPGYGKCVEELCERLELGRVTLVGNSMGGFTSAECAIQYPDRVEALVLVSAAGISSADLKRQPAMAGARLFAAASTRVVAHSEKVVRRPRLRLPLWGMIVRHPQRIGTELLYEVTRGAGRRGFLPALEALTDYDFRDRLTRIGCPTLIVWGAEDVLVPVADADEFERLIDDSRKLVFDDTGHMAMIERPETFNQALAKFLSTALERPRALDEGDGALRRTRDEPRVLG